MEVLSMIQNGYRRCDDGTYVKNVAFPARRDRTEVNNCHAEQIIRNADGSLRCVRRQNKKL